MIREREQIWRSGAWWTWSTRHMFLHLIPYDTAKVLLSRGMNIAEVADFVGLDVEDIEESIEE